MNSLPCKRTEFIVALVGEKALVRWKEGTGTIFLLSNVCVTYPLKY